VARWRSGPAAQKAAQWALSLIDRGVH